NPKSMRWLPCSFWWSACLLWWPTACNGAGKLNKGLFTMKTVTLYGLKKCSTCIKAIKWLEQGGIAFDFIDYRDQPVEPKLLKAWAQELGGWEKLVNRASMTWRKLPD